MTWSISYSVIPSFERSTSLYLRPPRKVGSHADLYVYDGGLGLDFDVPPPFWKQWDTGAQPTPLHVCAETAESIYSQFKSIGISPAPDGVIGCDGVTYELELMSGMNRLSLRWWEELPQQWDSLKSIIDQLESLRSTALKGDTER